MAGPETHGYHGILHALRGDWNQIDYGAIRDICRDYRDGSDKKPGSDNWSTLAYLTALLIAWKRPSDLHRIDQTKATVRAWWDNELTVRLRKGLQLSEERSRIYCIFSQAPICWLRRAFVAIDLADIHLRYVRATAAQVALCAYPVRPERLSPEGTDNPWPVPISVPLAGARSFEPREYHHMLHSAYEMFAADLLGLNWSRGGGSQTEWAREVIRRARPGLMGLSGDQVESIKSVVRRGDFGYVEELLSWIDNVGTTWPCRLIRFERGSACIGLGKSINGNTSPIMTMAVHKDGTVHYLAVHTRAHRVDAEPCGVNEFDRGEGRVKYVAWAGGQDWPRREYVFKPDRWGRVLWDVHLHRDGNHVVRRPAEPETPVPPEPGPEPPSGDEPSWWVRHRVRAIAGAVFLASIIWALQQRGCW